ncbi:MAG TPA: cell wall hydrolase [Lachnospiraceae bacterium]|nr:cell wall hydrolase [Lachnospiraceae bacterium]
MDKSRITQLLLLLALILLMVVTPLSVSATSTQDKLNEAQKDKNEINSQINQTQDSINGLKDNKNSLQGQLKGLHEQLTEVSESLEKIEQSIFDKEIEITLTRDHLEQAKETEKWQYECMKERIKFMYERSNSVYLELILKAGSFSDFLNKAEYINKLEEYDRKMLKEYQDNRIAITATEALLVAESEELKELKEKAEEEKGRVSRLVANTSNYIAVYADEIYDAEQKALEYEEKKKIIDNDINTLKKKLAEEKALSALAAQSAKRDISAVSFAEGDRYLLANIIYCEAGGESYAGQLAVGSVVMNRLLSSVFPDSIFGVIYQNRQFSPVASGRYELALAQNKATPSCYQAADEAMSGATNVSNCLFFRTPIEGLVPVYAIGGHIFY